MIMQLVIIVKKAQIRRIHTFDLQLLGHAWLPFDIMIFLSFVSVSFVFSQVSFLRGSSFNKCFYNDFPKFPFIENLLFFILNWLFILYFGKQILLSKTSPNFVSSYIIINVEWHTMSYNVIQLISRFFLSVIFDL